MVGGNRHAAAACLPCACAPFVACAQARRRTGSPGDTCVPPLEFDARGFSLGVRSEAAHGLAGERTESGAGGGRHWRHASVGGWFSYRMQVLPEEPIPLLCTYLGNDAGLRTFDVLIDGVKVATQQLQHNAPGESFDVELELPPELTRGKGQITVRFQGHPGNIAGGVFGCATLKARQ